MLLRAFSALGPACGAVAVRTHGVLYWSGGSREAACAAAHGRVVCAAVATDVGGGGGGSSSPGQVPASILSSSSPLVSAPSSPSVASSSIPAAAPSSPSATARGTRHTRTESAAQDHMLYAQLPRTLSGCC